MSTTPFFSSATKNFFERINVTVTVILLFGTAQEVGRYSEVL